MRDCKLLFDMYIMVTLTSLRAERRCMQIIWNLKKSNSLNALCPNNGCDGYGYLRYYSVSIGCLAINGTTVPNRISS